MRPLSLAERALADPSVSLASLLTGDRPAVGGGCETTLGDNITSLLASSFPGMLGLPPRTARAQLDDYLDRIVLRDVEEQGLRVRRPDALRGWLVAYAAATATTVSYTALLDAATPGDAHKPARGTIETYRAVLRDLWLLDPLPGWAPTRGPLRRVALAPKHHLADPALAARLLGIGFDALLTGRDAGPPTLRDGDLTGRLFESLVALSVRTYAQAAEARVYHLRTRNGDHEIDLIVQRDDGRVVAVEVKIAPTVTDDDVRGLHWLGVRLGPELLDATVVTTGRDAYRRRPAVANAGLQTHELADHGEIDPKGVANMHRSKGRQYRAVTIIGAERGELPLERVLDRQADEAARAAFLELERNLLYVACTRARERLLVTGVREMSPFLGG